jgi:hypothetical protein
MINKILQKYDGFANYWYPNVKEETVYQSPDLEKYRKESDGEEHRLKEKYKLYIPKGWYGFSFGSPTPKNWFLIIDEFLEYLVELQKKKKISGFEIHQIKMKFGSCRFYISYKCNDDEMQEFIYLQIQKLESHLHDDKLIY